MAKKSIKVNPKSVADVPSGDVNITYNGTRIAGLSESTSATLETEETLVMHDIEVEYTKPAGGTVGNVLAISNNTDDEISVTEGTTAVNENYAVIRSIPAGNSNATIFSKDDERGDYFVTLTLSVDSDIYDITVNDTPVSYNNVLKIYSYRSASSGSPINGQTYALTINYKEGE